MSLDERPTPEYLPVQPNPMDSVRRRARTPHGVPVLIHDEPLEHDDIDSQDSLPVTPLEKQIERVVSRMGRRKLRWLWGAVGTSIVGAIGALVAVLVKMLDGREAEGVDKQRLRYVEEELRYLRGRVDRSPRDEQPLYPPWPPSYPSMAPAPPKEPTP